jgi:hypothetical protein
MEAAQQLLLTLKRNGNKEIKYRSGGGEERGVNDNLNEIGEK